MRSPCWPSHRAPDGGSGGGDGFPRKHSALGTEPFWNFTLDGERFGYTAADAKVERSAAVTRQMSDGKLTLSGIFADQPLSASIHRETCSDGMSDRTYPMEVTLTVEGKTLMGCAYPGSS